MSMGQSGRGDPRKTTRLQELNRAFINDDA
jgi:hypothetical protein